MATNPNASVKEMLLAYLKELHLPAFRASYEELARQAQQESSSYEQYLLGLAERECQERRNHRVQRLLHQSRLPLEKSWQTLDLKRLPTKVVQQARSLLEGSFVDRHENVLVFGQPGSGKTHLLCAGPRVGASGSARAVCQERPVGARVVGRQARPEIEPSAEAVGWLRGVDPGRPWLRAAKP